jgi:hypothetical protein
VICSPSRFRFCLLIVVVVVVFVVVLFAAAAIVPALPDTRIPIAIAIYWFLGMSKNCRFVIRPNENPTRDQRYPRNSGKIEKQDRKSRQSGTLSVESHQFVSSPVVECIRVCEGVRETEV